MLDTNPVGSTPRFKLFKSDAQSIWGIWANLVVIIPKTTVSESGVERLKDGVYTLRQSQHERLAILIDDYQGVPLPPLVNREALRQTMSEVLPELQAFVLVNSETGFRHAAKCSLCAMLTYELNFWQAKVCADIEEAMPRLMQALEPDVRRGITSVDLRLAILAFRSNA